MRRLDIGIASYGNAPGLARTLLSIRTHSVTDWRCFVIVNPHPDDSKTRDVLTLLSQIEQADHRIEHELLPVNKGYAGAVNTFLGKVETPYCAYCDHDVTLLTPGWDEQLAGLLDRVAEVGIVFPGSGPYPLDRDGYQEILWGVGCCWMYRRCIGYDTMVGGMDTSIGHHEEVDYQTKIRLAGWKIAALPPVSIHHAAVASNDPASEERIKHGVENWVTKWERYFGGRHRSYFSQDVLRHELWPTSALYLEEYWKKYLPGLNDDPEVKTINGIEYDMIKVPRYKGYYRHRII